MNTSLANSPTLQQPLSISWQVSKKTGLHPRKTSCFIRSSQQENRSTTLERPLLLLSNGKIKQVIEQMYSQTRSPNKEQVQQFYPKHFALLYFFSSSFANTSTQCSPRECKVACTQKTFCRLHTDSGNPWPWVKCTMRYKIDTDQEHNHNNSISALNGKRKKQNLI